MSPNGLNPSGQQSVSARHPLGLTDRLQPQELMMANPVPDVKIVEVVKGLILAAGLASNVAAADVRSAADTLAKQYGKTNHREIEAEIARHLRNKG